MPALIAVKLLPAVDSPPHPLQVDVTARWALRQATRGLPHGVSRLDVLEAAARLALKAPVPVAFRNGQGDHSAAEVLEMLAAGRDPRPESFARKSGGD